MTASALPAETSPAKERIFEAALALFKERGLANVSTRDVSIASRLSRSHLYHYFADWSALRGEVFAKLAASEMAQMSQAVDTLPPADALAVFVTALLPAEADSSWSLWLDAWDEALRDAEFAQVYVSSMHGWEAVLAKIMSRGVEKRVFKCDDTQRAAKQLFAAINGYASNLLLDPSPDAQSASVHDVMALASLLLRTRL
jgi:AcrR family transcriptional regulator